MASSRSLFRLSESARIVLFKRFWFIAIVGLVGAVAGDVQAEKVFSFYARSLIDIGYFYTPAGPIKVANVDEVASDIQDDIEKLGVQGIEGRAFSKTIENISPQRGFIMISIKGNDRESLERNLDLIVSKHLQILKKAERKLSKKFKRKRHALSSEVALPFRRVISNKASRTMLPTLYGAMGITFSFTGLLLLEWLKRRKKSRPHLK